MLFVWNGAVQSEMNLNKEFKFDCDCLIENIRRTKSWAVPALVFIGGVFAMGLYVYHSSDFTSLVSMWRGHGVFVVQDGRIKTILWWNKSPHRVEILTFGEGQEAFVTQGCEFAQCELITSKSERPLDSYDAIIFNIPDLDESFLTQIPSIRKRRSQRMIFFTQESPANIWRNNSPWLPAKDFANFFNWTMTYRRDSDIHLQYGRIIRNSGSNITSAPTEKMRKNFREKTKLVVWVTSHCRTHGAREKYVAELQRYIPVDIYGDCGPLKCKRTWDFSTPHCYAAFESTYKFYLSFENSICTDYVTEKFFYALSRYLVPVVYGGADYKLFAPPHSYIDARAFEPKELANYLRKLDSNESLYNEHFLWKDRFTVDAGLRQLGRHGLCDLCKKLMQDNREAIQSELYYERTWNNPNSCFTINEKR